MYQMNLYYGLMQTLHWPWSDCVVSGEPAMTQFDVDIRQDYIMMHKIKWRRPSILIPQHGRTCVELDYYPMTPESYIDIRFGSEGKLKWTGFGGVLYTKNSGHGCMEIFDRTDELALAGGIIAPLQVLTHFKVWHKDGQVFASANGTTVTHFVQRPHQGDYIQIRLGSPVDTDALAITKNIKIGI